ncbi:MAG: UDP-glucose/GDP-mannose dehydrogenase family protein [Candidatus Paceibacterota bacterium]
MNITIIGTGFVGVVTAAVYASFGHDVIGLDIDEQKIASLKKSRVPFYEPGLEELLKEQQANGNLTFTTNYETAIKEAEVILVAVGTPSAPDGQADLRFVFASVESLAPHLQKQAIVVIKSTVPPGTLDRVEELIRQHTKVEFYTAAVPEFLKEGSAVEDTLHPDRIVIGATNEQVFKKLEELHRPLQTKIIKVKPESAQMAKYAANAYLATRITFINQIADLCEKNGANVEEVVAAISLDKRIGAHYWYPGFGYGGSCFPKDVKELAAYSRAIGESDNLFNKVNDLNQDRVPKLLENFEKIIGGWKDKQVAILGLSFKPNTDDMRESPATLVIPILLSKGTKITSFDPMSDWQKFLRLEKMEKNHQQVETIEQAVKNADVIISLVEWPEIIGFDFAKTKLAKQQWFIDARNQFSPAVIKKMDYHYLGLGRPS